MTGLDCAKAGFSDASAKNAANEITRARKRFIGDSPLV